MDGRRFDRIAASFSAGTTSRRTLARIVAGAVIGVTVVHEALEPVAAGGSCGRKKKHCGYGCCKKAYYCCIVYGDYRCCRK
jgi:hypothetical protein